jgi:hypothetical protein
MRLAINIVSLVALILSVVWLIYKPGFDSGVSTATALAALLASFLLMKDETSGGQSQRVSGKSIGIQAGRDANVNNLKSK